MPKMPRTMKCPTCWIQSKDAMYDMQWVFKVCQFLIAFVREVWQWTSRPCLYSKPQYFWTEDKKASTLLLHGFSMELEKCFDVIWSNRFKKTCFTLWSMLPVHACLCNAVLYQRKAKYNLFRGFTFSEVISCTWHSLIRFYVIEGSGFSIADTCITLS